MNKKIIGILSAVTLLGGAVYLSGQGGLGGLSSNVLSEDACTQAGLDAQKTQYEAITTQIEGLEEQISSLENSISAAEESIVVYQTNVAKRKQEIQNTNQEVNQLENYIQNQCGVKKTVRGKTTTYSAPDCNAKKNQVSSKKQQINNLEQGVNATNSAIQAAQGNIQNQKSSLQQLENSIAEIEEFVAEYDACEMTLAIGSGENVEVEEDNEVAGEEDNITTNPETQISDSTTTSPANISLLSGTSGETECNRDILVERESEFFDIYLKLWEYSRGAYGSKQGVGYTVAGTVESLQSQIKHTKQKIDNLEDKIETLKTKIAALGTSTRDNKKRGELTNELNTAKNDLRFQKNTYLPALEDALQIAIQKGAEINQYKSTFLGYQKSYQDCLNSLNIPLEGSRVCGAGTYANNCLLANGDFSGGFNRKS